MRKINCKDCQHWEKVPKIYIPCQYLKNTYMQITEHKKACYLKNRWHFETLIYTKSHGCSSYDRKWWRFWLYKKELTKAEKI